MGPEHALPQPETILQDHQVWESGQNQGRVVIPGVVRTAGACETPSNSKHGTFKLSNTLALLARTGSCQAVKSPAHHTEECLPRGCLTV